MAACCARDTCLSLPVSCGRSIHLHMQTLAMFLFKQVITFLPLTIIQTLVTSHLLGNKYALLPSRSICEYVIWKNQPFQGRRAVLQRKLGIGHRTCFRFGSESKQMKSFLPSHQEATALPS